MKKTSRILALALALCMCLCLVACGTGSSGDSTSNAPASSAPEASAQQPASSDGGSAEEPTESPESDLLFDPQSYPLTTDSVELSLFARGNTKLISYLPTGDWDSNPAYLKSVDITGVSINFQTISNDSYPEQFRIIISSGDYPDMIGTVPLFYNAGVDDAIESEIIMDLSPYIEDYAPDYYALMEQDEYFRKCATTDGGKIACFYQKKMEVDASANRGPFIRQDWLDSLDMEVPETYDELHDVLAAFKTEKGASQPLFLTMYGVLCGSSVASGYGIACGTNGVDPYLYQVDGKVECGFLQDSFKDYLTMMNTWYNEGLISDSFTSNEETFGWGPEIHEAVANGESGYYVAEYRMAGADWATENVDPNCVLEPIPEAVVNKGDTIHINSNANIIDFPGLSISTACEYPELAVAWNNFWYTEEGIILANYGEEGVTYEVDDDGTYRLTDYVLNNPDGIQAEQILYQYCFLGANTHLDNKRFLAKDATDDREVWGSNKDGAYDLPASGILTNTLDEGELYNKAYGEVLTYVQENVARFITGERSLDEFDDFKSTLIELGVQDMIDVTQAALDRFNNR